MRAAFVLAAFLASCAHHAASPTEPEHDPAPAAVAAYTPALDPLVGPAWVQATGAYVVEGCNRHSGADAPAEGDTPSVHIVDAGGGIQVRQACGLITYELYTPA